MFVDQVKIYVKAGNGGDGMVAFRREKFVPNGGPAGGDGGKGADVVFVVDEGLRTLVDFRFKRIFKAEHGEHGMSKSMHGRGAEDLVVKVPQGTIVKDIDTGEIIADLVAHGQRAVIAKAGRGGRGNKRFATPANPAPELSENGEPGQERNVQLELKVLADVGLVGFPSVGKSTLLSVVSAARPKIAAYHFTTIVPNLGMVDAGDGRSFVMADLPGLIEGASQGVGLGHQFLRHIERTRVIVHVIDMSGSEGRVPYEDYMAINNELEQYNLRLMERPQIIVANKMDMPDAEENLNEFKTKIAEDIPVFPISAVTKTGLRELLLAIADKLETTPEFPLNEILEQEDEDTVLYKYVADEPDFEISREPDGTFVLSGAKIERLFTMTNFERDASISRFARQLRAMGVDEALRKRGAKDGDIVRLLDYEFEFMD
ncbi:GTPase ObgE [Listeria monocytogenes]|uniref:GTPase Obg n=2 Tax=Listeria monocytogenes TaxID=1639 RepID=OBG_LISMH|nr:GTPase ObgE [Listeria monocytogenes]B8DHL1.1 RecName: Full=GTPase Obg; AltName: Full=GTP-binding protein Obg [Listeria monocytogenes HCC23]EAF4456371.1 GTPase ObgE [Listeria monocytogenes serotype 1/2a]ACK39380.1 Spo0B-associated GTP-binding protein [Listeria monocytogenes HCC23]AEH92628.1 putative conserved GTP binding protein [Listeria monocytogenes M7]AKS54141.1 GTPase ObgE [Listeria monocytogenes]EAC6860134.1 GTPase ObgE [Listeria monocytogenes]